MTLKVKNETQHGFAELDVEAILAESPKAFRVLLSSGRYLWVAKSQIDGVEKHSVGDAKCTMRVSMYFLSLVRGFGR